ncbi:MAG: winged helix-turn-helix domain-containing protein [Candidatus Bathyarchaeota archaeon]|nr:winged helix-turn-helix domain-containing protein [Candidatus Bathyarchaeum sp.]
MTESGEETYSTMFTSLKHPARRKILRMLAGKPKNFSRILEELGISSSHLTYHLENLGELVTKMDDGRYRLSTFGQAAVLTMKGVEETPDVNQKHFSSLAIQWKTLLAVLMIGIIGLSVVSYTQYVALNKLSVEHEQLTNEFEQLSTNNQLLLSLGVCAESVVTFLKDVIQLDLVKYQAELERHTVEYRADLNNIVEEYFTYRLKSEDSELSIDFRFRNQTLSRYILDVIEGTPVYSQQQSTSVLEIADDVLQRYQNYAGVSYVDTMKDMLSTISETEDIEKIEGDMKLIIANDGKDTEIQWITTVDGIDYQARGVSLSFDNGVLESLSDGWFLFKIGSTEVNISEEEAIQIAMSNAPDYSWTAEGVEITDFVILEEPVSADLWPHIRDEPLELIPYWYIVLQLDKVYPGNVNSIGVGIWADTGAVSGYSTISTTG